MLGSEALDTQAQIFPEVFGKREKLVLYLNYILFNAYFMIRGFPTFLYPLVFLFTKMCSEL